MSTYAPTPHLFINQNNRMKKTTTLTILLMITAIYLFGQNAPDLHRVAYKNSILVEKNSVFEQKVPASPYVFPNRSIQIYPGETIYIEILLNDTIINSFKAVKEIKDPAHTVTISFKQTSENDVHKNMILSIHNPFSKKLYYEALMSTLANRNWVRTKVIPVAPKLSGIEIWPDLVLSLGLGNWHFRN